MCTYVDKCLYVQLCRPRLSSLRFLLYHPPSPTPNVNNQPIGRVYHGKYFPKAPPPSHTWITLEWLDGSEQNTVKKKNSVDCMENPYKTTIPTYAKHMKRRKYSPYQSGSKPFCTVRPMKVPCGYENGWRAAAADEPKWGMGEGEWLVHRQQSSGLWRFNTRYCAPPESFTRTKPDGDGQPVRGPVALEKHFSHLVL